jgi:hypothetical protein
LPLSSGNVRGAGLVALVVVVAFLLAYAVGGLGQVVGGALAILVALAIGWLSPRAWLPLLALATLPAAVIVGAHLVPAPTRYVPTFVVSLALGLAFVRALRAREVAVALPPRAVALAVAAYLGWSAVTTPFSSSLVTSVLYLAGMAGTLLLAFVVVPSVLAGAVGRRLVATTVGILAGLLAVAALVIAALGPITLLGQTFGLDLLTELYVGTTRTGLIVPRTTGVFDAPAEQSLALAVGLVAILSLRRAGAGWRALSVVVGIGLVLPLARDGWLAAAGGAVALLAAAAWARRAGWAAILGWGAFFFGLLVAVTLQLVVLVARPDLERDRYGQSALILPEQVEGADNVRGGASLSGRIPIWAASVDAIAERPVVGWGLGEDPDAIAPHLQGQDARFRGLTSHNTWLRTAVEIGLPGLAAFAAVLVAVAWTFLRDSRRARQGGRSEDADQPRAGPAADDLGMHALVGIIVALLLAQGFETLLLGGLNFPSFIWTLALGMVVARPGSIAVPLPGLPGIGQP